MPLAQVNGTEIWYEVKGEGEPIILLPGLGLDHGYYRLGEPLLRRELKTIVVDPRGIGQSRRDAPDKVHYTPELFGGREQSMHLAHVASVMIDRHLFFADVMIESSGGASPVRCHGHRKADAVEMKRLIEQYQSEYYRTRTDGPASPGDRRPS